MTEHRRCQACHGTRGRLSTLEKVEGVHEFCRSDLAEYRAKRKDQKPSPAAKNTWIGGGGG